MRGMSLFGANLCSAFVRLSLAWTNVGPQMGKSYTYMSAITCFYVSKEFFVINGVISVVSLLRRSTVSR